MDVNLRFFSNGEELVQKEGGREGRRGLRWEGGSEEVEKRTREGGKKGWKESKKSPGHVTLTETNKEMEL